MAGLNLFYMFGISCFMGAVFFISNLVNIRLNGRALIGPTYKKGSEEYKALLKFASNKNITIAIVIFLITCINLFFTIRYILTETGQTFAVWFMPIFAIVIFSVVTKKVVAELSSGRQKIKK